MHTQTLKKLALALTFWLALHASNLKAQMSLPLGPYTGTSSSFGVDTNGLIYSTGAYGTGLLSLSGSGTKMFWFPGKAAFRAGGTDYSYWDSTYIGQYSAAFGLNTEAFGAYSTALGHFTDAHGTGSFASGAQTTAWGNYSTASGIYAQASGVESSASGYATFASGQTSTASGYNTISSGTSSIAGGRYTTASGVSSFAMGFNAIASGYSSSALGFGTVSGTYASFVIGRWNKNQHAANGDLVWNPTDPLFEIGNGTNARTSDALVVYKSGNAVFSGPSGADCTVTAPTFVTTKASGDIPMYTGN